MKLKVTFYIKLLINKVFFILFFLILFIFLNYSIFKSLYISSSVTFNFINQNINISQEHFVFWHNFKTFYNLIFILSNIIILNYLYNFLSKNIFNITLNSNDKIVASNDNNSSINLFIGKNLSLDNDVYISQKGLYQNILITGGIGSGKTSSAMYPFTKQLISYECNNKNKKFGMLILDVKGNYYKEVLKYAKTFNRQDDVIIISLDGKYKYNPLDKPNIKPIVLADRLKEILLLFSQNNSDSYWLDKSQQIISECIKICRLYNDGYVTFYEIHKLITSSEYLNEKLLLLKNKFLNNSLSYEQIFDLNTALEFFKSEFFNLDSKVLSIIKSEITRITSSFVNDLSIKNIFCPSKSELNFNGFHDVVRNGKIVVLNMNIAQYKNLSKIIAAYLKLDFQSEVMQELSCSTSQRTTCFISDEYQEYVTSSDADFFSQSREAKCINIVSTQSYTSILNTLKDQNSTKVIIQNLINKLWFRTDDVFTIEEAQKQIGKEDKTKTSSSISENAKETKFNYITNTFNSNDSSISESINTYTQTDFVYDFKTFTQELEVFNCVAFLSDGKKILKPCKLKTYPIFLSDNTTNKKFI